MARLIVIGNGMAAHRLVDALTRADTADTWQTTVIGEEPRPAYDRVALSSYFDGAADTDLALPDLSGRAHTRTAERHTAIYRVAYTRTTSTGAAQVYTTPLL